VENGSTSVRYWVVQESIKKESRFIPKGEEMICPNCGNEFEFEEKTIWVSEDGLCRTTRIPLYCPKCYWPQYPVKGDKNDD